MEPCQKLFQHCRVLDGIFFAALAYLPPLQVCGFYINFFQQSQVIATVLTY